MSDIRKLSRRSFIATAGLAGAAVGGLMLAGKFTSVQNRLHTALKKSPEKLHLFIRIGTDNRVTLVSHRVEMGQGVRTGLPLILAEELDVDWSLVDVVQAPGDADYGNQYTAGSRSVLDSYRMLRELGAAARKMLEQAAAQRWNASATECQAIQHRVVHKPSARSFSYGELAELAATLPVPAVNELSFKPESEFRYIGKATRSVDCGAITRGAAVYASDIHLPNMLYAVVEHAPVIGARLISCDESEARRVPGVVDILVLPEQDFPMDFKPLHGVAVVANSTWAAIQARRKLKCQWSSSKYSVRGSAQLRSELLERINTPGEVARSQGDPARAFAEAARVHESTYALPYLVHAPMEPPVAVADVRWNSCRMWVSSQDPQRVRYDIATLLDLPLHNVEIKVPLLGGGFGRKAKGDFCSQAALISARVKCPVKLIWTREDDIRFGYYHAMSVIGLRAGLDGENRVSSWSMRAAYPSIQSLYDTAVNKPSAEDVKLGFASCLFEFPHMSAEIHSADEAARIGWFRSVSSIQYGFANNCFADELAALRQSDPYENLLDLIGPSRVIDPAQLKIQYRHNAEHPIDTARLRHVLALVAEKSGYQRLSDGSGWGLAVHFSFPTYCAAATRVRIEENRLIVEEVHIALDCGLVVNADSVRAQLEGSVIFALSFALAGKIDIQEGQVLQSNFHDYPILRINQCPNIVTHLVTSARPPSGVGEPGVPVVAPSLVNAIFAATGQRFRTLPLNQFFSV